jgi:hypothetical protein
MAIILPSGTKLSFDVPDVNDQYKLYPGDDTKGLLVTRKLYQKIADPKTGDYNFGDLTELYNNHFADGGAHWRKSVKTFQEVHPQLKSVIIAALTHQPDPLGIHWDWNGGPVNGHKKGSFVDRVAALFRSPGSVKRCGRVAAPRIRSTHSKKW